MKILLSAFACEPFQGSEPQVGWGWVLRLAELGHWVSVLTQPRSRAAMTRALAALEIAGKRRADVNDALGDALANVGDSHLNRLLSHSAKLRCHEFSWPKKIQRIYGFAS